ncbi:hypothetical protein KP509_39G003000 [Ceratopteris richardii]|uniref:EGF-like domain-containing protein n=1 Tax=Ceratopteris richardii TaxID=49495 RepID=A0A8T2PXR3_CERRI|nr:hypothetical protein KP509_39G003000 [Ceratopteris richardii]KAH7276328.1 hypothetical protein KP509_39G003000 [Ceratopteris richardii]KAH7276329.1 hypothetical protein KP509_39G003000 [Ceratopteris richardii]KAH7276330.1 hypothetical protein KP509_39G003000 [Ceratopteris richardii]KAH7276332.1 hypothetical protein KP509_39G003000 [Ceratopteris richardii]
MAVCRPTPRLLVCLCCMLMLCETSASKDLSDVPSDFSFLNFGGGLACDLAKCLKGKCVNSSSFPFYQCQCNEGWQSPFRASWLPCILPNCSIDLTCGNKSVAAATPSPPVPSFLGTVDVCSLHVCGNGQCVHNNSSSTNSSDDYFCSCDPGYVNFGNRTDGFCIRKCSIGADCTNVNLPFGSSSGTLSPPPPAVASPTSASASSAREAQTVKISLRAITILALIILWR